MTPSHQSEYDAATTDLCERVLVTLLGDIGPWGERVVLVGGLAPRYIVGTSRSPTSPHAGTTDVDLVIELAVGESTESYDTLYRNVERSGFVRGQPDYKWHRRIEEAVIEVDFLCETDAVEPGRIHKPSDGTGSKFAAFNAPGAGLVAQDFFEVSVTAERLDGGGTSTVTLRVAGVLSLAALKTLAFQQRHHNKDAYDLIYTLRHYQGGPRAAGLAAAGSPIRHAPRIQETLDSMRARFEAPEHDGPSAYANFLAASDDAAAHARRQNEAVLVVREFLAALGG